MAIQTQPEPEPNLLPPKPPVPTQIGPEGIRFDFNDGCRVQLPPGHWRVRFSDLDTFNVLYDAELGAGLVETSKLYFQRFRIEVFRGGESVMSHDLDCAGQNVLIHIRGAGLGDTIGWLPYALKFQRMHGCRLTCAMGDLLIPLFQAAYPDVAFVPHEQIERERFYATYHMGMSFADDSRMVLPCDFRIVGTHRIMGYVLGVDPREERPKVVLADDSRPIEEPYVCIGTQSTLQCKYWNHPGGWDQVVADLKEHGYRVVCIDQRQAYGLEGHVNWTPVGAEDQTGEKPLAERARWLKHASFFIGLASGLSWLAWAMETPVVMISGFSHPITEFETPFRIINYNTCNSCWNDPRHVLNRGNFMWCPRHEGTPRQFECSTRITPSQVKKVIHTIPGFGTLLPTA